jgi:activating signal cointegrator complex subunit 2
MNTTESVYEPLDKQFRLVLNKKTNQQEKVPAIDRIFMEDKDFLTYIPPPLSILSESSSSSSSAATDEYLERLKFIELDLKWVLLLDYQHFWSQLIYDTSLKQLIDSYLKYAPRPHDYLKLNNLPSQLIEMHSKVQKLVFLVCLRMSTCKETKENFMSPETYSNLIYNNYLFDIPKIMDICVLFKKNEVLPKMIGNIFKIQEKYYNDFKVCIKDIHKAFDVTRNQLTKLFDLDAVYLAAQKKQQSMSDLIKLNLKKIIETIYYLTDFSVSLNEFIAVMPISIAELLHENELEYEYRNIFYVISKNFKFIIFILSIKEIFENTLFVIEDKMKKLKQENKNIDTSLK